MIARIRKMLRDREVSCAELTAGYLDAIAKRDGALHAYVTVTAEEAGAAAKRVDARIAAGETLGPLEGVPMNLKDNISTKGIQTTCASRILGGYVPVYDATVWERLKAGGAVMLGKTNLDEFAMGSTSETSCYGGTSNPLDPARVAGGSSGGLGASVAAGLAAYGLGSDTGGSIRMPASFCGMVGLKPTYGTVSRYGLIAYASSFDQIGIIASGAEDVSAVFEAVSGFDPRDATSKEYRYDPSSLEAGVKGMRIGLPDEYFEAGVRPDVKARVMDAAKTLEKAGAELVRISLPGVRYALPVYYILACAEASSNLSRYDGVRYGFKATDGPVADADELVTRTRDEGFGDEVKRRILLGTYVLSAGYYDAYYRKAQALRAKVAAEFERAFAVCDLLLTPTVPVTAPLMRRGRGQDAAEDPVEAYHTDICTVPVNIAGLPALSMPCGDADDGMPAGAQLIGKHFREDLLLRAALAHERGAAEGVYRKPGTGVA